MDVWHVGVGGAVDFRVSKDRFQEMEERLPGCREVDSVEKLLKQAEMLATKETANRTQSGWFEDYVSEFIISA